MSKIEDTIILKQQSVLVRDLISKLSKKDLSIFFDVNNRPILTVHRHYEDVSKMHLPQRNEVLGEKPDRFFIHKLGDTSYVMKYNPVDRTVSIGLHNHDCLVFNSIEVAELILLTQTKFNNYVVSKF